MSESRNWVLYVLALMKQTVQEAKPFSKSNSFLPHITLFVHSFSLQTFIAFPQWTRHWIYKDKIVAHEKSTLAERQTNKKRITIHCDKCLDRNKSRGVQGLRECWEKLPGTPSQPVQGMTLGALGRKTAEGHEGEWRAGIEKGVGIFSAETHNLAMNKIIKREVIVPWVSYKVQEGSKEGWLFPAG